ncbi:MAG: hypothetical protein P8163_04015 [Candidatus Thiodiazotropha sp.]
MEFPLAYRQVLEFGQLPDSIAFRHLIGLGLLVGLIGYLTLRFGRQ